MTKTTKTTKPAKATKQPKAETKVEEAKTTKTTKPEAVARDKFGCREGSQAATINAALTTKPKTSVAIAEETGLGSARVRAHLKYLVAHDHAVESDEGFAIKANKTKK